MCIHCQVRQTQEKSLRKCIRKGRESTGHGDSQVPLEGGEWEPEVSLSLLFFSQYLLVCMAGWGREGTWREEERFRSLTQNPHQLAFRMRKALKTSSGI